GSASTVRWVRSSWPTSSASTSASGSCACFTRGSGRTSSRRRRSSSSSSRPAASARRPGAASTPPRAANPRWPRRRGGASAGRSRQQRADGVADGGDVERLGEQVHAARGREVAEVVVEHIAAHEREAAPEGGIDLGHGGLELGPAHAGHAVVAQDGGRRIGPDDVQRVGPRRGQDRLEAGSGQGAPKEVADRRLIVEDQDPWPFVRSCKGAAARRIRVDGGRLARRRTGGECPLTDRARGWPRRSIAPTAIERDEAERFDRSIFREMGELGLTGAPLPEAVGGSGFSYLGWALVMEEIGAADMASAV